ncbi:MAG: EF-hand domain-containing protein [Candidatus Gastranaerophilales bacterium]|nr:EF-hand domain-containing protein [Candidatus Gastranaerophilales bacterium]
MTTRVSSQYLFTNSQIGLQRIYQLLDKEDLNGLSATDLTNYEDVSVGDLSFVQLLQKNFSGIDTDDDGTLSSEEYEKMINTISEKGMTYQQLQALAQSGSSSDTLLQTVLEHFGEVDTNGDGMVSQTEIDAYSIEAEIAEKKEEYNKISSSNYSIMYGEDSDDDSDDEE